MNARNLWLFLAGAVFLFICMRLVTSPGVMIVMLNGLFCGALVGLVAAYVPLIMRALHRSSEYPDVRQFSVGRGLAWASIAMGVAASVYVQAADLRTVPLTLVALARWTAICGAVLEVYSPEAGLNLGWTAGRDRTIMNVSLAAGLVVAVAVILAQRWDILA
jgi:hypothetical protein